MDTRVCNFQIIRHYRGLNLYLYISYTDIIQISTKYFHFWRSTLWQDSWFIDWNKNRGRHLYLCLICIDIHSPVVNLLVNLKIEQRKKTPCHIVKRSDKQTIVKAGTYEIRDNNNDLISTNTSNGIRINK